MSGGAAPAAGSLSALGGVADGRSAAIAAMSQRLAAAGPRTRRRLMDRQAVGSEPELTGMPYPVAGERLAVEHCSPPRNYAQIVRRGALLGASAICGFGLVLLAQDQQRPKPHRDLRAEMAAAQPAPTPGATPATAPASSGTEIGAGPHTQFAPSRTAAADSVVRVHARSSPGRSLAVATAKTHARGGQRVANNAAMPPGTAARSNAAAAAAPPAWALPAHARAAAPHAAAAVVASNEHTSPRHAVPARFELPRWVTDGEISEPRPIVMSPPPHALVAPLATPHPSETQEQGTATIAKPPPPPAPQPDLVYASSTGAGANYTDPPMRSPYAVAAGGMAAGTGWYAQQSYPGYYGGSYGPIVP